MSDSADSANHSVELFVQVEKGHPDPEELAAVVAVLRARAAADVQRSSDAARTRTVATWRRPRRRNESFESPHSWRGRTRSVELPRDRLEQVPSGEP